MPFRYHRSLGLPLGFRLNVGKRSVGVSAGGRWFRSSWNTLGRRTTTIRTPITGLSYVKTTTVRHRPRPTLGASSGRIPLGHGLAAVVFPPLGVALARKPIQALASFAILFATVTRAWGGPGWLPLVIWVAAVAHAFVVLDLRHRTAAPSGPVGP